MMSKYQLHTIAVCVSLLFGYAGQLSGVVADACYHLQPAQVLALPVHLGVLLGHHGLLDGAVLTEKDAPQHSAQGEGCNVL